MPASTVQRLFLFSLIHGDIFHLAFNLCAFIMVAPQLEKDLGSFRFAYLLLVVTLLLGLYYLFLTGIAAIFYGEDSSFWYGCATGFSGNVLACMVIWVYSFTAQTRISIGPAIELPITIMPPVLLLLSLLFRSATFWCHVMGLAVGFCYVQGWLRFVQLTDQHVQNLESTGLVQRFAVWQGFVSVSRLPTVQEGENGVHGTAHPSFRNGSQDSFAMETNGLAMPMVEFSTPVASRRGSARSRRSPPPGAYDARAGDSRSSSPISPIADLRSSQTLAPATPPRTRSISAPATPSPIKRSGSQT
ncbi:uncharacterized protein MONBRDRAFT_5821 [Monosiga brevicollis MX1]|uniref:Peptidase S54 rhomboid domain-containing protein n=1 Tax=Monosiga brevicollis TaxID=81824 RepID=A9USK3_MONBE|nr:uncharacterized protein MONBRDRAFT_5821 [Monosiga brevicollis MX1]EDQ92116.1 predicted protein [Monosiga brevicollis MX1]|eukprot:XP_001743402.1 hypothetical protein [Monosiga brevicollis MX1]